MFMNFHISISKVIYDFLLRFGLANATNTDLRLKMSVKNLCSCVVNSQSLFCSLKAGVKCSF